MINAIILRNGVNKLILVPGDEVDRLILENLFKGGIKATIHDKLQVGETACSNAVVITSEPQVETIKG